MQETALVTGGAGFIGSHLVDGLLQKPVSGNVHVLDNLVSGDLKNLANWKADPRFHFVRTDLASADFFIPKESNLIFHFAANPDVKSSTGNPELHYTQNIFATYRLLEKVRKSSDLKSFVFLSTSTVYGEPEKIPTPEDYGPLKPISIYGASKLACESLISAYAYCYGFRAVIFRLANVIGARSNRGVISDFVRKLRTNSGELEILGDGTQNKSYLYIQDCIDGLMLGIEGRKDQVGIFNLGSEDQINVLKIANIVCESLGLQNVKYKLNTATPGGRGWMGDVKFMKLDITKLKQLGWAAGLNSEEAVRLAVRDIIG